MAFTLELSPSARQDLKRLPERVQEEIVFSHLPEIQKAPLQVGRPLQGTFKGERSYHFGRKPEYRIVYFVEGEVITVTIVGTEAQNPSGD